MSTQPAPLPSSPVQSGIHNISGQPSHVTAPSSPDCTLPPAGSLSPTVPSSTGLSSEPTHRSTQALPSAPTTTASVSAKPQAKKRKSSSIDFLKADLEWYKSKDQVKPSSTNAGLQSSLPSGHVAGIAEDAETDALPASMQPEGISGVIPLPHSIQTDARPSSSDVQPETQTKTTSNALTIRPGIGVKAAEMLSSPLAVQPPPPPESRSNEGLPHTSIQPGEAVGINVYSQTVCPAGPEPTSDHPLFSRDLASSAQVSSPTRPDTMSTSPALSMSPPPEQVGHTKGASAGFSIQPEISTSGRDPSPSNHPVIVDEEISTACLLASQKQPDTTSSSPPDLVSSVTVDPSPAAQQITSSSVHSLSSGQSQSAGEESPFATQGAGATSAEKTQASKRPRSSSVSESSPGHGVRPRFNTIPPPSPKENLSPTGDQDWTTSTVPTLRSDNLVFNPDSDNVEDPSKIPSAPLFTEAYETETSGNALDIY